MRNNYETIVIGGGQAGLSTSYYLKKQGRDHIVLEKSAFPGNIWRIDRWDSFTLLTPNWAFQLPGDEYSGPNPEGFLTKEEVMTHFENYVERFQLPIQYQTQVNSVELSAELGKYVVTTDHSVLYSDNVVVATGLYQAPKMPDFHNAISKDVLQLHSGHYRNPQSLPQGAVLVVGSGQSGSQIVDELLENGRKVYLSIGRAGRIPRRYRGRDSFEWLLLCGFFDKTVDELQSFETKFDANPQVSGRSGGKSLNLHQFAHDGVVLLGHVRDAQNQNLWFADDLKENLIKADNIEKEIVKMIDHYIIDNKLNVPPETLPQLTYGFDNPFIEKLDLKKEGITTIIWACGYSFDFSLVRLPVFDNDGFPIQIRGVTECQGLYFIGLPWLYKKKSSLLLGVGEDADYIVSQISNKF